MKRSHVLARELRGTVVIVLVAMMIFWLFARLNDDRAEAKARIATADTTTTTTTIAETTTTTIVDDNQRLCSLSAAFRTDLSNLQVVLVTPGGAPVNGSNALPIDIGLHDDGDIPEDPTETAPEPTTQPSPRIVNPDRIDPLESGLLGAPQKVALNFYGAAASLRLGLIDADFDAALAHFDDMVMVAEPLQWNLAEIAESDLADRWTALISRPNVSVDGTLDYIEEQCAIRIGSGFLYREKAPELPILEQVFVDGDVDPGLLRPAQPDGDG